MTSSLRSWEDAAMAYRDIRIIGDPVLRTECDWITDIDDSVKSLVEDLLETVDEDGRAGLAANQIGIGLRAFSWNIDGEIGYILNPRIVEVSKDEYQDGDEGCLSVPGLWFPTERAWYARAEGVDLDGREVVVEGEELMARCIQHECDHLEGHLYLDRLDRKNRAKAMKELRAQGRARRGGGAGGWQRVVNPVAPPGSQEAMRRAPRGVLLADAVQPTHGSTGSCVAEGLELVVPGLSQSQVELAAHPLRFSRVDERSPDPVLGDDDVAVNIRLGVEDPQIGGMGPAAAVGADARLLSHLVAQVRPAAQGRRKTGSRSSGSHPAGLGPHHAPCRRLLGPVQVDT